MIRRFFPAPPRSLRGVGAALRDRWTRWPVRHRGSFIVSIPALCLFASLGSFAWLQVELTEHELWVRHTQQVRLETKRLLTATVDAETGTRGYGMTRQARFLEPYETAIATIPATLDRLEVLVRDNDTQTQRLQHIRAAIDRNLELLERKIALQRALSSDPGEDLNSPILLYEWLEEGKTAMDALRAEVDRFAAAEEALLAARSAELETYRRLSWGLLALSALTGTFGSGLAVHLFWRMDRELAAREARLRAANRQLDAACDRLQRFTADASHELRAPWAAVLSNAQVGLLAPAGDGAAARQRLEKIAAIAKGTARLIDNLLLLARTESVPPDAQPVDLRAIAERVRADLADRARDRGVVLVAAVPERPVPVRGNADLLHRALSNLAENACRYTPEGGRVTLALEVAGERAIARVRDRGCGIPAHHLPHLFERFYRADRARSRHTGGYGLGLAIVAQIARAHGGEAVVESTEGEGSTFTVILPLANLSSLETGLETGLGTGLETGNSALERPRDRRERDASVAGRDGSGSTCRIG